MEDLLAGSPIVFEQFNLKGRWRRPFTMRIVSLQPSVTVTLAGLGALDQVVACTRYCKDVCPEITQGKQVII
jgi:ABC-type hemin transport system substrate-binding protein